MKNVRLLAVSFLLIASMSADAGLLNKNSSGNEHCNTNIVNNINGVFIDKAISGFPSLITVTNTRIIQLFTHGRPGQLLIQGEWKKAEAIAVWLKHQFALTNYTHINIYGCEFAKGEKGLAAVSYLQKQLGITVAASTNITGKDGDWKLEVGQSTDALAFPAYQGNLQCPNYGTAPSQDYDCDGIINSVDIDDDNDGILDEVESGNSAPYQILPADIGITSTASTQNTAGAIDVSSNLGLLAGSVLVTGSSLKQSSANPNNFNSVGAGFSRFTFSGTTPVKITITHGSSVPGNIDKGVVDISGVGYTQTTALTTNITSGTGTQIIGGNSYTSYFIRNTTGATINNTTLPGGGNFVWNSNTYISDVATYTTFGGPAPANYFVHITALIDIDTDGDGIPNRLDLDSDGDGCPDAVEADVAKTSGGPAMQNGDIKNGSGGTVTSQPTVTNAIVAGPYGANGFANSVETSSESGVYNSTYTYSTATNGASLGANCSAMAMVVPVYWLSVKAELQNEKAKLVWRVAEKDVHHYIIQRSLNGNSFSDIGRVDAHNNSGTQQQEYNYVDQETALLSAIKIFYRIISVDIDGRKQYSLVVSVSINKSGELIIYPVPATTEVDIQGAKEELSIIRIYNTTGQDMTSKVSIVKTGETISLISIAKLPGGVYYLKTKTRTGKFVKQF